MHTFTDVMPASATLILKENDGRCRGIQPSTHERLTLGDRLRALLKSQIGDVNHLSDPALNGVARIESWNRRQVVVRINTRAS